MIILNIRLFGAQHTRWTSETATTWISEHFPDRQPLSPLSFDPETNIVSIKLNQEKLTDVQRDWLHLSEIASAIDEYTIEPVPEHTLTLTGDQAKAIECILAANPLLARDFRGAFASTYVLATDANANSLVLALNRNSSHHLTQTSYGSIACLDIQSDLMMDAICAAWIAFRMKYLADEAAQDEELGDLDEKPF